jgi:hypothetical protein
MKKDIYIFDDNIRRRNLNFKRWSSLNTDYTIIFYKYKMCCDFIFSNYDTAYYHVFNFLEDRTVKRFFWSLCIIYKYGGFVVENDIIPLVPIDLFLESTSNVVVSGSPRQDNFCNFDTSFMGCDTNNEIIKRCIMWYVDKFNNGCLYTYEDFDPKKCLNQICSCNSTKQFYKLEKSNVQVIKQKESSNIIHCIYSGVRVFNKTSDQHDNVYTKNYEVCYGCCMITHYANSCKNNSYPIYEVNKHYCEINNIDYCVSSRKIFIDKCCEWERFLLIYENLPKYDYIISVDPMVMFYVKGQDINMLLKDNEEYDFIFSNNIENTEVNIDIMIIKNTPYSLEFIKKWIKNVVHDYKPTKDILSEPELALKQMRESNFMNITQHEHVFSCGYLQTFVEKKQELMPFVLNFNHSTEIRRFKAIRRNYFNTFWNEFDEEKIKEYEKNH